MKQVPRLKAIKILLGLFAVVLLIYGCGTDSSSDPKPPVTGTSSNTNTDTNTSTSTNTNTDFSGSYQLYNEFRGCLSGYINFRIAIDRSGNRATILDQDLTCRVVADELICSGTITDDDDRYNFQNFTLWHTSGGGLEGDSDYTFNNSDCSGQVTMTTTLPSVGSAIIVNETDRTFRSFGNAACNQSQFNIAVPNSPFAPGNNIYYYNLPTGCRDFLFCTSSSPSDDTCGVLQDIEIEAAKTRVIHLNVSGNSSFANFADAPYVHSLDFDAEDIVKESKNTGDTLAVDGSAPTP